MLDENSIRGTTITDDKDDPDLGIVTSRAGQYKKYLVLTKEEISKGYIRPLRRTYFHVECQSKTKMAIKIAQTFARNPTFYDATYCYKCQLHKPLREFLWVEGDKITNQIVGT
jgi:hypothetical protein